MLYLQAAQNGADAALLRSQYEALNSIYSKAVLKVGVGEEVMPQAKLFKLGAEIVHHITHQMPPKKHESPKGVS